MNATTFQSLFLFILMIGLVSAGCATMSRDDDRPVSSETAALEVAFAEYEIPTGSAKHQTVLTGFFLGGRTAEIAVVNVGPRCGRRLRIHTFVDGKWELPVDTTLGSGVLFVDVARIDGRDRLITYEPGRLRWFDPETATERPLMDVAATFNPSSECDVPAVDITRDLNRDGRDDVIFPDVDGFWIATQLSHGGFTGFTRLGPPEPFRDEIGLGDSRIYGEMGISAVTIPRYLSRVHGMDYNHDGRSDLVFWNGDHFDVHLQDPGGRFDPEARRATADVPFDLDGAYSLAFGFGDESTVRLMLGLRRKSRRTVLHSFRDVNGDGVADMVTHTLVGRSLFRQHSRYQVHFGARTRDGTLFARDVGAAIDSPGRAGGMQPWGYSSVLMEDFNGDGAIDVMLRDVNMGIGRMMRVLVAKSVAMDSAFFRGVDGASSGPPTAIRKIRPAFSPFDGGVFFPAVLMGDVNGDGRSDLLVGHGRDELHVFPGVPGPDLLAREPRKVAVALPDNEQRTWLADVNQDAKQDILIHDTSTRGSGRVTILIAR